MKIQSVISNSNKTTIGLTVLGILLLITGLSTSPDGLAEWLSRHSTQSDSSAAETGTYWLLLLLTIDGLLLLMLALTQLAGRSFFTAVSSNPLWDSTGMESSSLSPINNKEKVFLVVITLIAVGIRLPRLNGDLWIDEVLTVVDYVQFPLAEIVGSFKDDNQHLLFSLLSRISVVALGTSPWAIRLPALIFGVASIWCCYILARYLFTQRVAVLSTVLLSLSFHHVWYSQNARGYTMLLFGTLLSTYFLLCALRSNNWRFWCAAAVAIAFSAMSHLTAVFVAVGQALVLASVLLSHRADRQIWFRAIGCFLLAGWVTTHGYALALPDMARYFFTKSADSTSVATHWKSPIWLINEFFVGFGVSSLVGWGAIVLGLVATCYVLLKFRGKHLSFLLFSSVPAVVLGLIMLVLDRNLWPRLFFNFGGFAAILLAYALVFCHDKLSRYLPVRLRLAAWLPAVFMCAYMGSSLLYLYKYPKQDYTGAREYIFSQMGENDQVVGVHMAGKVYSLYYEPGWPVVDTVAELERHELQSGQLWIVYTLSGYLKSGKADLYSKIDEQYELMQSFPGTLGDGKIYVKRLTTKD